MRTAGWTDTVSVLDRMSAILDALSDLDDPGEGLGISELARRANLPKSTVSRIAADLVDEGYLDRVDNRLHLGLRLFELGQSVERPLRLRRLASPTLTSLRDATGHNVQLAIADGDDVIVIATARGRDSALASPRVGDRLRRTTTALGAAFTALEQRRESASSHEAVTTFEANHGDHICVASPIHERGHVVAAIALSDTIAALDAADAGASVRHAAAALSRRITIT